MAHVRFIFSRPRRTPPALHVLFILSSTFVLAQVEPHCFSNKTRFCVQGLCNLHGLTYSPYRVIDTCPSAEEAAEDVAILMKHTRNVRTYTTLCRESNRILMRYASEGALSVLFGVWIDNVSNDQKEVDHLMEALREFPEADLRGIAVGNEIAFRGSFSEDQVAQLVTDMRDKIRALGAELGSAMLLNVPVFTIDIIPKPSLMETSDLVAVNLHPFFRSDLKNMDDPEEMSKQIIEATAQQIDIYRNLIPDKELIITEIGWPSDASPQTDPNPANMQLSHLFMKRFTEFAALAQVSYYFFEIFDADWKKAWYSESLDESLSEFHWGLYPSDRSVPKFPEC